MTLPFLMKHRGSAGVSTEIRKPDQAPAEQEDHAMMAAAQDILSAVSANDHKALARAFRAAFEILEMEPHQEVDHGDEE